MKAVVQRVKEAEVVVAGKGIGSIGPGLLIFLGVGRGDDASDASYLADKLAHLRIFEDEGHKMNRSLLEMGGEAVVVSEFTLYGDCRKGRRPSFAHAAPPEQAEALYRSFVAALEERQVRVATGEFRARMQVRLVNDGPVTLILDSREG